MTRSRGSVLGCIGRREARGRSGAFPSPYRTVSAAYFVNADANGRTANKIAHHSPRDNSTIIIKAAPSGRTVSP